MLSRFVMVAVDVAVAITVTVAMSVTFVLFHARMKLLS